MKKIAIIIILAVFWGFIWYETAEKSSYSVLEVISPTEIAVDLNHNGIKDDGETILLENTQSFSTKSNETQADLAKKLGISEEDAMGLGFFAENFAKEKLAEKKIKLTGNNKIYIDDLNYETLILNSGLAINKNGSKSPEFNNNLKKVRKLDLRIFNEKSHKYHKLHCKYGRMAHNSEILPLNQLPKEAKPCNFCLSKREKEKEKREKMVIEGIPYLKSPAIVFTANDVKIFLTDLTTVSRPSNDCATPVCKTLLNEINSAQNSIDFAIYGYTKVPKLQTALENAHKRGVKIRFVYDLNANGENIYPDTLYLTKILTNNRSDYLPPIMHNKFFIFDGQKVLTGSANISNTDLSGFNSNAIILINSPQIADLYEQEFEQMFAGKFHTEKQKIEGKEHIIVDNTDFSIYFSPKDNALNEKIIPLIDGAQKYIYMPVFLVTHKGLAQSLVRASKRGVAVKVIIDATNSHGNYSAHKLLRENEILVKTENYAGKLHSKSIIIDDSYTIIGSMNFSRSGSGVNDENLIIIKNSEIARFYKTFFQYLWQKIPDKWLKLNARAESLDSIGSCSDGIDNDFDGKIDKADDSCRLR